MTSRLEFATPWLVQRIDRPYEGGTAEPILAPMGFSQDASKIIGKVMQFAHMGASEFEWDAVPLCLKAMADRRQEFQRLEVNIDVMPPSFLWDDDLASLASLGWQQDKMDLLTAPIWFVVFYEIWESMVSWVKNTLAYEEYPLGLEKPPKFIKSAYLHGWLAGRPPPEALDRNMETVGWLDLRNCAFWTIDKTMFDGFCTLLGVTGPVQQAA